MRYLLILAMAALIVSSVLAQEPFDGICPVCKNMGIKSTVEPGGCTSTLMFCGNGHYDEEGNYTPPRDCNHTTCNYQCSNGHSFQAGVGRIFKRITTNNLSTREQLEDAINEAADETDRTLLVNKPKTMTRGQLESLMPRGVQ